MNEPYDEATQSETVFGEETALGLPDGVKIKNFSFHAKFGDDDYEQKETAFYEELDAFLDEHEWYDVQIETRPFGVDATSLKYQVMVKEAHVFYREEDT